MLNLKKILNMEKIDLHLFTRDELENVFVTLVNGMEKRGNECFEEYEKSDDIEFHCMGAVLLTRTNQIQNIILMKKHNGKH